MIISQRFEQFTVEWDTESPDKLVFDAYDLTYVADLKLMIQYIQEIASQSAKPGQAHIPASPCPADTLNTPPNSRHPGAIDSEVK